MAQFNGERYATKGVQAEVSPSLQALIWGMIEKDIAAGLPMDYLQVFVLKSVASNGRKLQRVEHRQEVPERDRLVIFDLGEEPVTAKVFVIDSGSHVTMLLAGEY